MLIDGASESKQEYDYFDIFVIINVLFISVKSADIDRHIFICAINNVFADVIQPFTITMSIFTYTTLL